MSSQIKEMYHTQERRRVALTGPVPTTRNDAWLGFGYYFWHYQSDAVWWGRTAKKKTGYYQVYSAVIDCSQILDTVFNEEHYNFWIKNIEKAIQKFLKSGNQSPNLKYLNDFFKEKGLLEGIEGVQFQDISDNPDVWIVNKFQYKKRIQLAVYNLSIISNFALRFESECA